MAQGERTPDAVAEALAQLGVQPDSPSGDPTAGSQSTQQGGSPDLVAAFREIAAGIERSNQEAIRSNRELVGQIRRASSQPQADTQPRRPELPSNLDLDDPQIRTLAQLITARDAEYAQLRETVQSQTAREQTEAARSSWINHLREAADTADVPWDQVSGAISALPLEELPARGLSIIKAAKQPRTPSNGNSRNGTPQEQLRAALLANGIDEQGISALFNDVQETVGRREAEQTAEEDLAWIRNMNRTGNMPPLDELKRRTAKYDKR